MADDINSESLKQQKIDTDALTASTREFNDTATKALDSLKSMGAFASSAGKALFDMAGGLQAVASSQQSNALLTQKQTELFSVMATSVLGATKAFDAFGDQKGLNTFGSQIEQLINTAERAEKPFEALIGLADKLHINLANKAIKSVNDIKTAIAGAAKEMAAAPDSALKLQNGFLQMAAASGNLGTVFQQSGKQLQNINSLLQTQAEVLIQASKATGTDTSVTTAYYNELGKIPGYLNAQIDATDNAGNRMNMLTAAMKLAHGTGQTFDSVLQDLTVAFNAYGVEGEKALEFTARIADLSQKYNIQIQDTRGFMTDMANSFKFLGDNIDSASSIFNRFFSGLRESGLSTKSTVDILNTMTEALSRMSIAQKAFLSARTGGPGGLVGAVQIERDLREGRADLVMQRIEQALKQQFGRIVTQQEATTGPAAAQQFVRQRMFLTQGPFGQLVGGEAQATRLLEALARPGGYQREEASRLLQKDVQRGTEIEQKSYTQLTQINIELEAIRMFSGITALSLSQRAFTPATQNEDLRRRLTGGIVDALKSGREATTAATKTQQDDRSARYMTESMRGLSDVVGSLGDTANSAAGVAGSLVATQSDLSRQANRDYEKTIEEVRRSSAVDRATRASLATPRTERPETREMPKQVAPITPQNIIVHVEGICPECHKKFVKNPQKSAISNAPDIGPGF